MINQKEFLLIQTLPGQNGANILPAPIVIFPGSGNNHSCSSGPTSNSICMIPKSSSIAKLHPCKSLANQPLSMRLNNIITKATEDHHLKKQLIVSYAMVKCWEFKDFQGSFHGQPNFYNEHFHRNHWHDHGQQKLPSCLPFLPRWWEIQSLHLLVISLLALSLWNSTC